MVKPKVIAFYLPQYHPIPENDKWFGKGFTEWTNVGKAKPLFKGHYQPKVPADLGYYDLRVPEVREAQAELAREAGIYGFCYWHYWHGNGNMLLEKPFEQVLESGKPDFPFCLGWANHSWIAKNWDNRLKDEIIAEQIYPGEEESLTHFNYCLKAFKDSRYIKIDNKPLFFIFRPWELPDYFIPQWRRLAKENGFDDMLFIGDTWSSQQMDDALKQGFDYVTVERLDHFIHNLNRVKRKLLRLRNKFFRNYENLFKYEEAYHYFLNEEIDKQENVIPMIIPNWDHSPRSKGNRILLHDADPKYFYLLAKKAVEIVKNKKPENQLIILKSWNEWGEGNYMEPDLKYGKGYIKALRAALDGNPFNA